MQIVDENGYLLSSDKPKVKKKVKYIQSTKRKTHPEFDGLPFKYRCYIIRAKNKSIDFSLTLDEFNKILEGKCEYCGEDANTIDRTDSSKGYTNDNCVPSCYLCNMMKYTHSADVFLNHVNKIYNHNKAM